MHKTVTVIVPAFNEGKNIKRVLTTLKEAQAIGVVSEIIVVDDGSKDNTTQEAINCDVKVLKLTENKGKARAMAEGLKAASSEFCLFIDADLTNLRTEYIAQLVKPLSNKENCMTIAKFINGRLGTDFAHTINTNCSGQRAAKTELFRRIFRTIEKIDRVRYGIEYVITSRIRELNVEPVIVEWEGVGQIRKEEKWGFLKGSYWRLRMYVSMNLGHLRNFFYKIFKLVDIKKAS